MGKAANYCYSMWQAQRQSSGTRVRARRHARAQSIEVQALAQVWSREALNYYYQHKKETTSQ